LSNVLILASRSPRRHELLALLGVPFSVEVADVDETPLPAEAPDALVVRLSQAKALAVAARSGRPVLAADTIVALDGALLGKPADAGEAATMLRALRSRVHHVHTAVSLAAAGRLATRLSTSEVTFRDYDDEEMVRYIATGDPLDKAGAYAIQHTAFAPVARWRGCYTGIMGLPLREVAELLASAGLAAPDGTTVAQLCQSHTGDRCQCRREE